MKKLRVHILGALLLSSVSVYASSSIKKRKSYDCQSDSKITEMKKFRLSTPEYSALIYDDDGDGVDAEFVAQKNVLKNGEIRTMLLTKEIADIGNNGRYLVIQGKQWALAIAPEKKRASLYNMNPDINEVPMFCLSQ